MKKKKKDELAEELLEDLIDESEKESSVDTENSDFQIEFGQFSGEDRDATKSLVPPPVKKLENTTKATSAEEPPTEIAPVENTEKIDLSNAYIPQDSFSLGAKAKTPSASAKSGKKLVDSENLKVAKNKINDIEQEMERLRIENEELGAAAETFKNKADSLQQRTVDAEKKYSDLYESVKAEKEILMGSIKEKEKEFVASQEKNKELESRLQTGVKKIRVRERELENRLELIKLEGKALLQSKDDMILSLKRQIDQINMELENTRARVQEATKALNLKQEILRRTVKTLRLALSLLETEEAKVSATLKKVD